MAMSFLLPHLKKIFSCTLLFCSCFAARTQGNLQIFPKRIVLDASRRSQELSLANSGKDTARYIISVIHVRMKEDGSVETVTEPEPGQNFADKNFRFFPRTVVLPPNEAQTVKVQLTKANDLSPGEYRSHIYIRAEAETPPLGEEKTLKDTTAISVHLTPVFGISIPVILRAGAYDAEVNMTNIRFQLENGKTPVLNFILTRSGSMSAYGDITVDYVAESGKTTRVGVVKGVAVYTPNPFRKFSLALDTKGGVDYTKGALHAVFTNNSGPSVKLAQDQVFLR